MARNDAVRACFLICRCDLRLCALPLETVAETMRPMPLESLPDMPSFVLGVSIIRGRPVPVVSLASLVGAADGAAFSRFVTLKTGGRLLALAVEEVMGVRELDPGSIEQVAPLLREAGSEVISAITTLDAELLLVLQSAHLIPESVWRTLAAEALPA